MRLLVQVRERIPCLHYSFQIKKDSGIRKSFSSVGMAPAALCATSRIWVSQIYTHVLKVAADGAKSPLVARTGLTS